MRDLMFALSATSFAAIFLISIIVLGGDQSRSIAIFAALVATVSQFTGPDPASYRISIYSAYAAFVLALVAFIAFSWGV
jgi:hypothetical protein